jgi:hypothetical protein
MRLQRQFLSDSLPVAPLIRAAAKHARDHRVHVTDDHPMRQQEKKSAEQITDVLNQFRDQRDADVVQWTRLVFGPKGLGALIKPDAPDAEVALARALDDLAVHRESALRQINQGGFAEAVCRIVLAGMVSIGAFERRSLRLARLLTQLPAGQFKGVSPETDWVKLIKEQARLTAVAPIEALNGLQQLLPDQASREAALAVSAAVLMIEPTLANPRSEIIEFLMGTLDADPERVINLARHLTNALNTPGHPATVDAAVAKSSSTRPKRKPAAQKKTSE